MKDLLEAFKWAIAWKISPFLERIGLIVISRERWSGLCKIEGDYYYLKHQLQRVEAKLEAAGISDDPAYEQDCPFCPLLLGDQTEQYSKVGDDFFGEPARVGDIPACDACATVINEEPAYVEEMVQKVSQQS